MVDSPSKQAISWVPDIPFHGWKAVVGGFLVWKLGAQPMNAAAVTFGALRFSCCWTSQVAAVFSLNKNWMERGLSKSTGSRGPKRCKKRFQGIIRYSFGTNWTIQPIGFGFGQSPKRNCGHWAPINLLRITPKSGYRGFATSAGFLRWLYPKIGQPNVWHDFSSFHPSNSHYLDLFGAYTSISSPLSQSKNWCKFRWSSHTFPSVALMFPLLCHIWPSVFHPRFPKKPRHKPFWRRDIRIDNSNGSLRWNMIWEYLMLDSMA